ncbi:MAG: terminase large subunit [Erysipelotrichaceae bacterium]|nr:terminase large subunit [Erysipelotrichaceae bacterium]
MQKIDWISEYYQCIKNGKVTVGKWVQMVYEYVVHGVEKKLFYFDQKKANDAIEWIETHSFHVEGPLAPGAFTLELWEKAFVSCVFGLVDEAGRRQFREVLLLIGRKNGKSILASAIANYVLRVDGGYGCKVFNIAPKLDQADIIYGNAWLMMQLDPEYIAKKQEIESMRQMSHNKVEEDPTLPKKRVSDIYIPATNSAMKKIAFSSRKSDGFNPSLAICDEVAAWQGDAGIKQYEVLRSGMGARPEGLLLSCTTSGYVNDGIFDELMKRSTRFLMGESKEQRLLPVLYMIDDPNKWDKINELKKSNPNLGVSVSQDYMLEEIAIAEQSLPKRAEFLTKYCNIKQNSSQAWLTTTDVEKNFSDKHLDLEDFKDTYAVCGIDLSQTTDLTVATLVIERKGKLYGFAQFFMPAEKIGEATVRDGVPYNAYVQRGILTLSGEKFVDYKDVFKWITDLVETYRIYPLKVGYDRYSAQYLIQDLDAYGFNTDDVYQGENLTPVITEVDGLIKEGRFDFGDNDLLKIHLLNSALKLNNETNRKRLVKISATQRIDGMAALLDAMCVRQKWFAEIGEQLKNED